MGRAKPTENSSGKPNPTNATTDNHYYRENNQTRTRICRITFRIEFGRQGNAPPGRPVGRVMTRKWDNRYSILVMVFDYVIFLRQLPIDTRGSLCRSTAAAGCRITQWYQRDRPTESVGVESSTTACVCVCLCMCSVHD